MRILICAEESAGIQTLRAAKASEHEIVAVLTTPDDSKDERPGVTAAGLASRFGFPVWYAEQVKDPDFATVIKEEAVDILLNVHSLHIVHEEVVNAPRVGAFNLHPGPLPRYAGMNAPSWAILNGESSHGVTLHWMEAGIDTGDIAWQEQFELSPGETGLDVSRRCTRVGIELIQKLLAADPERIPREKQDFSRRTYHGFERPFGGDLPWHSAALFEQFVRACCFHPLPSPWGIPTIPFRDGTLGILEAARTGEGCDLQPGNVECRGEKLFLATDDEWLELKRTTM
ncbi:MAG: hypothetical protein HKN23_08145 [Verrucomicrobiales bacterium]|nr:hypothetical protein [Verrucomicrobiales bacterium]